MSDTPASNPLKKKGGGLMSRRRKKAKKVILADGNEDQRMNGYYLRMERDLNEIEWPSNVKLTYKATDLTELNIEISIEKGYWLQGKYTFKFDIPKTYPIDAPKVLCVDKIYHPNIDLEGHVCVSVLKGGWKAIYTIQTIIFARIPYLPFERLRALHSALPYLGLLTVFITWSILSSIFLECYIPYQSWIFGFPGGDSNGI